MMTLCCDVLNALKGKTLVTAESCTGGLIGAELTAVPGSSAVYKGGVICYTNWVKQNLLSVNEDLLDKYGAVSSHVALAMAEGARRNLEADVSVSVTGLAGPGADDYGNTVGTVFIGYCDKDRCVSREYHLSGDREEVRKQAVRLALSLILEYQ